MVFIDSNVWIGWLNENDRHYAKSCEIFDRFKGDLEIKILVTSGIVYETVNHLFKIGGKNKAEKALELFLITPNVRILFLSDEFWEKVIQKFRLYNVGLTDAQIIAAMEEMNDAKIYSFDGHFDQVKWIKRISS